MKRISFIHFSDLHLDAPFSSIGNPVKTQERRSDLKLAFEKIINLAETSKVDFIFISGDLFEQDYVRKSTINFINDCFKRISFCRIVMIAGNHDLFNEGSYYSFYDWSPNVYILGGDKTSIRFNDQDVTVYSMGPKDALSTFNILLLHGSVDMTVDKNNISSEYLSSLNMDYIGLGHFHNHIPSAGGKEYIVNPGSPEPLGFDEEGEHGFYNCTLESDGQARRLCKEFIRSASKRYEVINVNVNGCDSNESIRDRISAGGGADSEKSRLLKIILYGDIPEYFTPDCNEITSWISQDYYFVKIKDNTRQAYNISEICEEAGLRGLFVRKMKEKAANIDDAQEREKIERAILIGLAAIDGREVEVLYEN